ncbi:hypothetical protein [Caulobacter sp. DWR2-3-1b2]|uniref:hypothetical protein n=1 Tax=unclassified Caulobacter TaxID=2648921 RepID=UPI003CF489EA
MSTMQAATLPDNRTPAFSTGNEVFLKTVQRRRVGEAETAYAIADWFAGHPWTLEDAQWVAKERKSVHLHDMGDKLVNKGVVIATRNPPAVPDAQPGANLAHLSEARAVARVALRGDHERLYGPRP